MNPATSNSVAIDVSARSTPSDVLSDYIPPLKAKGWTFIGNLRTCTPLIIQLVGFYAIARNQTTSLSWSTSMEQNSDRKMILGGILQNDKTQLNLSRLSSGIYFVRVGSQVVKVVFK